MVTDRQTDPQTDRRRGMQENERESDYAKGTGDTSTEISVHSLSTRLHNAFTLLTFSLAANFKSSHLRRCCHQETLKALTV